MIAACGGARLGTLDAFEALMATGKGGEALLFVLFLTAA
jgi:hypothetical protein